MNNPFEIKGPRGRRSYFTGEFFKPKAFNCLPLATSTVEPSKGPLLQYWWQDRFTRADFLIPPNSTGYKPRWDFRTGTDQSTATNAEKVVNDFKLWREHRRAESLTSHIWKPHPSSLHNDPYNNLNPNNHM